MVKFFLGDEDAARRQNEITRWSKSWRGWLTLFALIGGGSLLGSRVRPMLPVSGLSGGMQFLCAMVAIVAAVTLIIQLQRMVIRITPKPRRITVDYVAWGVSWVFVGFIPAVFS